MVLFTGLDDLIVLYPVYALLFADTGLSTAQISTLFVLWSGAALLLEVPSGALADRVSRRWLLAIGSMLRAIGFALWVVAPSYPAFAIGFLLWSVKGALTSGTLQALVYDELVALDATDRYPRMLGRAGAAEGVAQLLATAAAAPLLAIGDFRLVGALSVVACLLQVPVAFGFPEAPRAQVVGGYLRTLRTGVGEVVRQPALRRVVLAAGLVPGLLAFDEYLPLLAREFGVPDVQVPMLLLVPLVAMTVASLLVGARRFVRGIAVPLLLAGGLVCAGALAGSAPGVVVVGLAIGAYQVTRLVLDARLQDAVTGDARATVTSVAGVLSEAGAITVLAGFAVGANVLDIEWLFVIDGGAIIVTAVVLALALRPRAFPDMQGRRGTGSGGR